MLSPELVEILKMGVMGDASDWHIIEGRNVSLRVGGVLAEVDFVCSREFMEGLMTQIMSKEKILEFKDTRDADFSFEEDGVGRFRANMHQGRGHLALSLRYVKDRVPPREELGLPKIVNDLTHSTRGIIFVTGITGAGKSTTLACMIEHMNDMQQRHIITIEDPIEYSFIDRNCVIEQREVGIDTVSFPSSLHHVLRQDPDVIVIGEMRDRVTFETALTAAETGHLVLSTLHTMDASQSITRILDMYAENEREVIRKSLAGHLRAIICQRLVPCHGSDKRVPAVEVMINTPIVGKLISENRTDKLSLAINASAEDGMISFDKSLYELIQRGTISKKDGLAYSTNPEGLQMNLRGIFLNTDKGSIISELGG
jgi:twitching motility protein PilT